MRETQRHDWFPAAGGRAIEPHLGIGGNSHIDLCRHFLSRCAVAIRIKRGSQVGTVDRSSRVVRCGIVDGPTIAVIVTRRVVRVTVGAAIARITEADSDTNSAPSSTIPIAAPITVSSAAVIATATAIDTAAAPITAAATTTTTATAPLSRGQIRTQRQCQSRRESDQEETSLQHVFTSFCV